MKHILIEDKWTNKLVAISEELELDIIKAKTQWKACEILLKIKHWEDLVDYRVDIDNILIEN